MKRYKKLFRYRFVFLAVVLLGGILLAFLPHYPHLSELIPFRKGDTELYFVSPPTDVSIGDSINLEVHVKTGREAINAIGIVINYDPTILQISSMTTSQSFCFFYTDNTFDNIKGEIRISCGAPSPGFTGDSTIIQAKLRVRKIGITEIKVNPASSQVLANDGKGTNLLSSYPKLTISSKQIL